MIRSVALALALLALLLAAPAWFPGANAQLGEGTTEDRLQQLEMEVRILSANLAQMYGGQLPPPVEVPARELVPFEAFSGPHAFGLECRAAAAVSASQVAQDRLGGGGRWVCVRPAYMAVP